jgi:hypothetical protein
VVSILSTVIFLQYDSSLVQLVETPTHGNNRPILDI